MIFFGRRVWRDLPVILRRLCLREQHLLQQQPADHAVCGAGTTRYHFRSQPPSSITTVLPRLSISNGTAMYMPVWLNSIRLRHQYHSLFADPLYLSSDTAAANLHTEGSAAYNKGNPETITDVLETDLDDQPRVLNDTIDCGAYEYYSEPVGIADLQSSILIYPNPAHQFIHPKHIPIYRQGCMMSLERSSASGNRYLNKYQQTNSFQDTICWCWTMAFNGIRFQL